MFLSQTLVFHIFYCHHYLVTPPTVKVSLKEPGVRVSGGGLPGEFQADHFHMHWGAADGWGSEHTIDGLSYPMEVRKNNKHRTFVSFM